SFNGARALHAVGTELRTGGILSHAGPEFWHSVQVGRFLASPQFAALSREARSLAPSGVAPGTLLSKGRLAGAGPGAALRNGPDFMPTGLREASPGLRRIFSGGSVRGRSIIDIRQVLRDNGFTQSLTFNRRGYLFRNGLGEEIRIMSRSDAWEIRMRNQFKNYLDEFGNVADPSATHEIQVLSR
ncbi:hypothetical protein, partial [Haloferula sp. A504]|uniref:hypothetical protein n=1 Tax=Haloferula sp. A504 TaxID=3373601 RepID=UPI0031C887A6|nr:hypothetical protein [Verrucomicrobiaceae bacterium E54]